MEVALRNTPQDVDKAGGHGQSHDPKIPTDMKIPLEPNLFWKSCLGPAGAPTSGKGGKVTGKVEVWLEAPLENMWPGLWMVGSGCATCQPGLRSPPGTPGSRG